MTVDAEQAFEKDHSIAAHGDFTYDPTAANGSAEATWAD